MVQKFIIYLFIILIIFINKTERLKILNRSLSNIVLKYPVNKPLFKLLK